jgi:hypothetical protein
VSDVGAETGVLCRALYTIRGLPGYTEARDRRGPCFKEAAVPNYLLRPGTTPGVALYTCCEDELPCRAELLALLEKTKRNSPQGQQVRPSLGSSGDTGAGPEITRG